MARWLCETCERTNAAGTTSCWCCGAARAVSVEDTLRTRLAAAEAERDAAEAERDVLAARLAAAEAERDAATERAERAERERDAFVSHVAVALGAYTESDHAIEPLTIDEIIIIGEKLRSDLAAARALLRDAEPVIGGIPYTDEGWRLLANIRARIAALLGGGQ